MNLAKLEIGQIRDWPNLRPTTIEINIGDQISSWYFWITPNFMQIKFLNGKISQCPNLSMSKFNDHRPQLRKTKFETDEIWKKKMILSKFETEKF